MKRFSKIQLNEARRYLPNTELPELEKFAARQSLMRGRLIRLKAFYEQNPCRMARLHLLATCAIALGRFAGFSQTFGEMGEFFMPLDLDDQPRTAQWREFIAAGERKMPIEVREELWLAAHFHDLDTVRENGLYRQFEIEAETFKHEPTWQLLKQHLDISLGVRLMDKPAIAGLMAYETAMADSLALTVGKLFTAGLRLVWRYSTEAARAILDFRAPPDNLISYRKTAFLMTKYAFGSLGVSQLFRRGLRNRERGRMAESENWQLLQQTLGDRISEIHPTIVDFYGNPANFEVTASLRLDTLPAKFWSRVLTLLFGQGLYESNLEKIPARFRVFSRADNSMHFVRELYCEDKLRVFDSDFVVRDGKLFEVFTDLKTRIEMVIEPTANKGLVIRGKDIYFYDLRMPSIGLLVEFHSRVEMENDAEVLKINGYLTMNPRTKLGQFFAFKILRRPKNLGSIHYVARRKINKIDFVL